MTTLERGPVQVLDDETCVLPAWMSLDGLGTLAMHAHLLRGAEPVLFDTGPAPLAEGLVEQLAERVDLGDLRWIWVTHADPDHTGGLPRLLERAPRARVVTSFLGAGKLGLAGLVPPERVHLVEAGETLELPDRSLVALRPPVFDAPETLAALDRRTGTYVAADLFGALLEAPREAAEEVPHAALADGLARWAAIDTPWLDLVDPARLAARWRELEALGVRRVLGAHLPPAHDVRALVAAFEAAIEAGRPGPGVPAGAR